MSRKETLMLAVVLATVSVAGCNGLAGPSVSETQVEVDDRGAELAFNYSVDDYATALLEDPKGEVVSEERLGPDQQSNELNMGVPESGTYTLAIQQGGETVKTEEIEFTGAEPQVQSVDAHWSGSTLQRINVTIENTGDLPVRIENATYNARGQTVTKSAIYHWVDAGETKTIALTPSFGESISVTEPGQVQGEVTLRTSSDALSATFQEQFNGPKLAIASTNSTWSGNQMEQASVRIQNTGDMPTTANVTFVHAGEVLATTYTERLPPNSTQTFDVSGVLIPVFQASSAGTAEVTVRVNSPSGFVTESITHQVQPARLSLNSINPQWNDATLSDVGFTVTSSGDLEQDFTVRVTVNNKLVTDQERIIEADTTTTFYLSEALFASESFYTASSGGTYTVTIEVVGPSGTTSKSATKQVDSAEGDITGVDTQFIENYDSDTADLTSLSMTVRNTGQAQLEYDSVEIEIADVSQTRELFSATSVGSGESDTEYISFDATVPQGSHELTIRLRNDGETVASETVSVSTDR